MPELRITPLVPLAAVLLLGALGALPSLPAAGASLSELRLEPRGEAASILAAGLAEPRALAAADFDEDGTADLVVGFAEPAGGLLTLAAGRTVSLRPSPSAALAEPAELRPFASLTDSLQLPVAVDFLGAGDFDADGHADVVLGTRGHDSLWWLLGDGTGALAPPVRSSLPGGVTALGSGEIGRRDGLADLAVGVLGTDGARLVLLAGPEGALRATPEVLDMPSEVLALAFGELDGRSGLDLAATTATSRVDVSVPDRRLSVGASVRGDVAPLRVRSRPLPAGLVATQQAAPWAKRAVGRLLSPDAVRATLPLRLDGDAVADLVVATADGLRLLVSKGLAADHVVNSTGDASDNDTGDGVCDTGGTVGADPECTLRAAIEQANVTAGAETVGFSIPGAGPHTIQPASVLPVITDPITLDGTTEPDFAGSPVVELDGSLAGSGHGLEITAGSSTVRGLIVNRFSSIGIWLKTTGSNVIEGNWLGLDNTGTAAAGNGAYGIRVDSTGNTVGGTTAAQRNVASGNGSYGIYVPGDSNLIQGNFVGTDPTGTVAIGNGSFSANLDVIGPGNTIGGTTAGAGNLVSGAARQGISVRGSGDGTLIQGNLIGTDVTGTADLGNGLEGVSVVSCDNVTVGGTTPAARNVVSGNLRAGVQLNGGTGNLVQGNYLGTDVSGTVALSNQAGVKLDRVESSTVGGTAAGAGNVASGNSIGVWLELCTDFGVAVQGNSIGVDANGDPLPNTVSGVDIRDCGSHHTIGGTDPGAGNVIAHNGGRGVLVSYTRVNGLNDHPPWYNAILGNSIHSNGALGIDLLPFGGASGVSANDAGDGDSNGGNQLQNFPVLDAAVNDDVAGTTTVLGSLNSHANKTYRIELFSNAACDASGHGEGEVFVGSTDVTTDGSGDATFSFVPASQLTLGDFVTATATDPSDNTSEFSNCVEVLLGADLSLVKSDSPDPVLAGTTLTYTLTVDNAGPETATNTTLVDTLPAGTTFLSSMPASPTCEEAGGVLTCDLGALASGAQSVVTVQVDVPSSATGNLVNTASVSSDLGDPTPDDATAETETTVLSEADLVLTKSDDADPVVAGSTLVYTLTVENQGPSDAADVTLSDTLPAGVTFVASAPGEPTCSEATGVVDCSLGALSAGASASVEITVSVDPAARGQLTNNATTTTSTTDPDPADNMVAETTQVTGVADLAVTKTDAVDPIRAGFHQLYTLSVENFGPSTATMVSLVDTLPPETTLHSATPSAACSELSGTVTCDLGTLAPAATAEVTLLVRVNQQTAADLSNVASVSGAEADPTPANDQSIEPSTVIETLFADDFESGDVSAWSSTLP